MKLEAPEFINSVVSFLETKKVFFTEGSLIPSLKNNPDTLMILTLIAAALILALIASYRTKLQNKKVSSIVHNQCVQLSEFLSSAKPQIEKCEQQTLSTLGFSAWGIECLLACKNIISAIEHRLEEVNHLLASEFSLDHFEAKALLDKKIRVRNNSFESLIASREIKDLTLDECPSVVTRLIAEVESEIISFKEQARA